MNGDDCTKARGNVRTEYHLFVAHCLQFFKDLHVFQYVLLKQSRKIQTATLRVAVLRFDLDFGINSEDRGRSEGARRVDVPH